MIALSAAFVAFLFQKQKERKLSLIYAGVQLPQGDQRASAKQMKQIDAESPSVTELDASEMQHMNEKR